DLVVDDVLGRPQRAAVADVDHEAAQQRFALRGVGNFGMELHAVPAPVVVGEGGDGNAVGGGGDGEAGRRDGDVVAVAHPDVHAWRGRVGVIVEAGEQCVGRDDVDLRAAE